MFALARKIEEMFDTLSAKQILFVPANDNINRDVHADYICAVRTYAGSDY